MTLDDINDEGAGSTAEAVDQAIYQSSAHLLSMFLEKLVIGKCVWVWVGGCMCTCMRGCARACVCVNLVHIFTAW